MPFNIYIVNEYHLIFVGYEFTNPIIDLLDLLKEIDERWLIESVTMDLGIRIKRGKRRRVGTGRVRARVKKTKKILSK